MSSFKAAILFWKLKVKHSQMAAELSSALLLECQNANFLYDLPRKSSNGQGMGLQRGWFLIPSLPGKDVATGTIHLT